MSVICKYYFSFYEELEHPQILVFLGGPGTNSSQIPRKDCNDLHVKDNHCLSVRTF